MKALHNRDVNVFTTNASAKSTRVNKNLKRSERAIDYGLSNSSDLILSQQICRSWHLSDHLPVCVSFRFVLSEASPCMSTVFDRILLRKPEISQAIKEFYYPNKANSIHEIHIERLRSLNVLREIPNEKISLLVPLSIKKAIMLKRSIESSVRSGLAPASAIVAAKTVVKKAIYRHKHKSYLRYVLRGINFF